MPETVKVTKCPICKGEIQATVKRYTKGASFTVTVGKGVEYKVDDWGQIADHLTEDDTDGSIYCQNDHSLFEMMQAIANQIPF